ncbi:MAG: hypothetical protein NUV46_02815 [Nanoarchaeota archaeon]|nr:hypothetical protein [Nanoarchaeota archaeon]
MVKKKNILIIIFSVLIAVILVWGLIGSSEAAEIGITCDFGVGEDGSVFCWTWHNNVLGELGETIGNILDN